MFGNMWMRGDQEGDAQPPAGGRLAFSPVWPNSAPVAVVASWTIAAERARLQQIFSSGVCDWTKPDAGRPGRRA
jgi:hypothetical protein